MKKIINIIVFLYAIFSFSQVNNSVTVNIVNMTYSANGSSVSNCGEIDLVRDYEVPLTFQVVLTRGYSPNNPNYNTQYGTGTLYIKSSSSTIGLIDHSQTNIQNWDWIVNGNNTSQSITLYSNVNLIASQYGLSNNQLYAEYNSSAPYTDKSCDYPIIKDQIPTFEINPTSTVVACNSTSSKNFSVSNVYNSPGAIQYNWSVGTGWKRNGVVVTNFTTSSSNITLVPYEYPPSDVSVTPVLDGVYYPQQTSIVSLSAFNPNLTVTGPTSICTTGSYALLGNIPSDWSVVWSLQNTTIANLNQTGNSATITVNTGQSGYITTNAFVTNSCGQSKAFTKQVFVGSPVVNNHQIYGGYDNMPVNGHSQLHVDWAQGNTSYLWTITTLSSSGSGTTPKFAATNSNTATTRYVSVNWGSRLGRYVVNCKAINSCSQTGIGHKVVTVFDQSNNPCPLYNLSNKGANMVKIPKNMEFSIKVYPNPVKGDIIYVNKVDPSSSIGGPCNNYSGKVSPIKEIKNTVAIYDFFGNLVFTKIFDTEDFKIENTKLQKGTYFLRVTDSYGISKKTTLKVN